MVHRFLFLSFFQISAQIFNMISVEINLLNHFKREKKLFLHNALDLCNHRDIAGIQKMLFVYNMCHIAQLVSSYCLERYTDVLFC